MDLDEFEAELGLLLTQMEHQPEDRYEIYLQLQEKINELRAFGMPVPENLKNLVAGLEKEFKAEAKKT